MTANLCSSESRRTRSAAPIGRSCHIGLRCGRPINAVGACGFRADLLIPEARSFRCIFLISRTFWPYPAFIRVDHGSEFISRDLELWTYHKGVALDFSRPGKPTDNSSIESFNGKFRAECLNAYWFMSLDDARSKMEDWRRVPATSRRRQQGADFAAHRHPAELSHNPGKFQLLLAQNRGALHKPLE